MPIAWPLVTISSWRVHKLLLITIISGVVVSVGSRGSASIIVLPWHYVLIVGLVGPLSILDPVSSWWSSLPDLLLVSPISLDLSVGAKCLSLIVDLVPYIRPRISSIELNTRWSSLIRRLHSFRLSSHSLGELPLIWSTSSCSFLRVLMVSTIQWSTLWWRSPSKSLLASEGVVVVAISIVSLLWPPRSTSAKF